jgi:lysophospholipase
MDWLKPKAETITTPLLVVGAGKDRICLTPQTKAFAARLPHADYVEISSAEHEILMERSPIRAEFWAAFDTVQKQTPRPGLNRSAASLTAS